MTSGTGLDEDTDLPLLLEALGAAGLSAEPVTWDADPVQWGGFDLAVIRSTWDYIGRLDEFLAWAEATARATRLWNPAPVVRWNSYLVGPSLFLGRAPHAADRLALTVAAAGRGATAR
ncbi:hypothetical protein ACFVJ8_03755 [Streptomyces yangpuensis]|uniref:hypothetical protein n=1 Tax=Streptomyces yangpuensis TaxID=1648182 RepID=UPI00362A1942